MNHCSSWQRYRPRGGNFSFYITLAHLCNIIAVLTTVKMANLQIRHCDRFSSAQNIPKEYAQSLFFLDKIRKIMYISVHSNFYTQQRDSRLFKLHITKSRPCNIQR